MAQPITTDQPDRTAPPAAREIASSFLLARLGSLFAFLPLTVWTLAHLWNNLAAYNGGAAWQDSVTGHHSTATEALTATLVLGPMLWHIVWGVGRMLKSRPKVSTPFFSNVRYLVQRLSAIGLLAFLGAHLYLAWFKPRILEGHPEAFSDIAYEMAHNAPTKVVYTLGILAIAYHLANGLWSFCMAWGLAVSKSALAMVEKLAIAFFVVLLVLGWGAIWAISAHAA